MQDQRRPTIWHSGMVDRILPYMGKFNLLASLKQVASAAQVPVSRVWSRAKSPPQAPALCVKMSVASAHSWLRSALSSTTYTLLCSYEGSTVCYTYDQAVGICAFIALADLTTARRILSSLAALQMPSGAFCTAYWTNGTPQEYNQHVGPVLWVALAALRYEQQTKSSEFRGLDYIVRDSVIALAATKAIEWSLQFQATDGGINGGVDWHNKAISWASVEHNLDALACFRSLGMHKETEGVRRFLQRAWRADEGRMAAGKDDVRMVLDTNSWMVLACDEGTDVPRGAMQAALAYCERELAFTDKTRGVAGFDFANITSPCQVPAHDSFRNAPLDDVWLEGTAHMALAYRLLGNNERAAALITEIGKAQAPSGGVPYSLHGTHNGYWQMEKSLSVAATSWLVLAATGSNPMHPALEAEGAMKEATAASGTA